MTKELKQAAIDIVKTLQHRDHVAVFAGGCVRDMVRGDRPKDYDVATSALPGEIQDLFPHHIPDGKAQGVIKVITHHNLVVDVATLRRDSVNSDGRRPDSVTFTRSLKEDSMRRDFTMNALYLNPLWSDLDVIDFHGGVQDIRDNVLRCVGNPHDRFQEDYLRILRAVRFASRMSMMIDMKISSAISWNVQGLQKLSQERIRDEFFQIIRGPNASTALDYMLERDILNQFLPELAVLVDTEQDPLHHPEGNAYIHTREVFKILHGQKASVELLLAGLLHDVGKAKTTEHWQDEEGRSRISHKEHERVGAEMAEVICKRLALSNAQTEFICDLVGSHMKAHLGREFSRSTLIRFLRKPNIESIIALQHADSQISGHQDKSCRDFYLDKLSLLEPEITVPALISGKDLIALGLQPGVKFKKILEDVRLRKDEGSLKTKEEALDHVRAAYL